MQKNVASQKIGCQMVSATDGSAFTGAVTVSVTGDAGTQATGSVGAGACTHEGNGYHTYAPAQAETNYDLVAFTFTGTGAVPATVQVYTRVDANVTHLLGTAWLTPGTAGTPDVNVKFISDDATAANNAEAFFDGTGYAGTNNVIPTVTTLTGHTAQTGDSYAIVNSGTHGNAALKALIDAVDNFVDTEIADLQSRLPAALVGGRMDSSVGAMAASVMTAAATAADYVTELQSGLSTHSAADVATAINSAYGSGKGTSGTIWRAAYLGEEPIFVAAVTNATTPSTQTFSIDDGSGAYNSLSFADHAMRVTQVGGSQLVVPAIIQSSAADGLGNILISVYEAIGFTPSVGDTVEIFARHVHSVDSIASANQIKMDSSSTKLAAIVADTNELQVDWANGGRLDLILDARASQSSLDTLASAVDAIDNFLDTEMAAVLEDTGTTLPAQIAALLTTAGAESYRTDGATGSVFQLLYEIHAEIGEFAISGTTKQQKMLDGTTNAFASTLNDATNPTSVTRAA